jgi:hypothetical protein
MRNGYTPFISIFSKSDFTCNYTCCNALLNLYLMIQCINFILSTVKNMLPVNKHHAL